MDRACTALCEHPKPWSANRHSHKASFSPSTKPQLQSAGVRCCQVAFPRNTVWATRRSQPPPCSATSRVPAYRWTRPCAWAAVLALGGRALAV